MNVIVLINIPKICVGGDCYLCVVFVLRCLSYWPQLSFFSFLLVGGTICGTNGAAVL